MYPRSVGARGPAACSLPGVSGINWGDVPTWGAVLAGAVGGTAALIQLRQQGNVLKGEVERNKRRDELLDGQLRELGRRAMLAERQQANYVLVELKQWSGTGSGALPPGSIGTAYLAAVTNESDRPIRHVVARLDIDGELSRFATRLGQLVEGHFFQAATALQFNYFADGDRFDLIRAGTSGGFAFPREVEDHRKAAVTARFTDDAGLHWEVDHDLSLARLDNRDDW